jgi:hypothetical protein
MNNYYTTNVDSDGFGAQYQKKVVTYIFCKLNNLNYLYRPFQDIEHNYNNDSEYINKAESLINLKDNIKNINETEPFEIIHYWNISNYLESNIDIICESEHMKFIKDCFWKNKNKNYFNNDKLNVAIHIRRDNLHDKGQAGERITTPNSYYLNIMNIIREKYSNNSLAFHIYSQGDMSNFLDLESDDTVFYLNYDICESFIGMVAAYILVTSPSSFSYVAALLSDGEIYYKKFWHNPRKSWNVMQ